MMRTGILLATLLFLATTSLANPDQAADLIKAASNGETARVRDLLHSGADVNTRHHLTGWTALIAAAYYGHPETVEALIKAGADVNAKDINGGTPLIKAVTLGPYEDKAEMVARKTRVVKTLLEAGADPYARDRFGVVVWQMPFVDRLPEIVEVFDQAGVKGVKEERLIQAIARQDIISARKLIGQGAEVNAKGEDGVSPWGEAVIWGNPEMLRLLMESGADVNATLEGGVTALMIASERGNAEWVRDLLAAGADVHARDRNQGTAWQRASKKGYTEVMRELEKAGAQKE